uniref:HAT C-terminal dimerisation domain-containing protein n=1 Tax=Romanomermis culicivorax TaxID=13658 RepID=A0A915JN91_ROMCU
NHCLNNFEHIIETGEFGSSIYDNESDGLDEFWSSRDDPSSLMKVVKMVLSLSHGNASVESCFSVNEDLLIKNLQESSFVNQRIVYDSIRHRGSPSNIEISKVDL